MLDDIREERLKKLARLKEAGVNSFPIESKRDFVIERAIADFSKLSRRKKPVFLAGRILAIRSHGGSAFCDFNDGTGSFQAFLKKDILGENAFVLFSDTADIGDFIEFKGNLFITKKKEKTIEVSSWRMLSKSLRPLPEKWHGLADTEERFRKRYLDLLMNNDVRANFLIRSKIIKEVRNFLDERGFLEVETPILQPMAGGAIAQPFKTHHNALDIELYLRIAPELYLKRLLIGGFPKVYEIGRNFRNEGIDVSHNPEFTELEFYEAYENADHSMDLVEEMIKTLVKKIFKKQVIKYEDKEISFVKKFPRIAFHDVLKRYALINNPETASREDYMLKARQFGIEIAEADSKAKIADNIFKKICRPKLVQPTFVVDYPLEISPLAKKKENDSNLVDRFQPIIGGLELGNGFSELNDPIDQKERFLKQLELRKAGDMEASELDESFIEAMEHGMPPAAGVGIGIERLVMLFTNTHNIKEIILFPTMRPK